MKTVFTTDHEFHQSPGELLAGGFTDAFEKPERAKLILERLQSVNLGEVIQPDEFDIAQITRIHTTGLVDCLQTAHQEWLSSGHKGAAYPYTWPARGMRTDRAPKQIDGKLGFYSFDCGTPITATSWRAIKSSVNVALTGAKLLNEGARSAFSLCRPPGHHASSNQFGGYCFLNNAAIAAQKLLDDGAKRVAILDIDYHHGNGTQDIFYHRDDVLFVSLHGDPDQEYPYMLGFADELGEGKGKGYNHNFPLPWGTGWNEWSSALEVGLQRIINYGADAIIVSLGVDTYKGDPISHFKLDHDHFSLIGERIKSLGHPTLFVMEGGYAVAEIGINTVNVLSGFES